MHSRKRLAAFLALPALVTAAVLVGPGASAPTGRTLTFTELDKGSTFVHIRNTKASERANSQGDVIAFTYPLAAAPGKIVGKIHIECVTTVGARNFVNSILTCSGVAVLRDGTLTLQATVSPSVPTTTGAVTGGTGAYANARGVVTSKPGKRGSVDTFTLVD
jgi:allene oxide cyclase-like protein